MIEIPEVGEPWPGFGHPRCCEEDYGGSHYHCARCDEVTGIYGHYVILGRDNKLSRMRAERLGIELPFEGFTCDPNNERE